VTAEHARLPAPFGRPNERDHVDHTLSGIHHVTAIGGEPQRTVDFYAGTLGLRLVKLTVNFDDPGTYHLYFGDELGRPGTILTFFPSPGSPRGHRGAGQATTVAFSVPAGSLGFWADRLTARSVAAEPPRPRLDEEVIVLHDPDGLQLELVADPGGDTREPCEGGPVPPEHAILGLFGVTLSEAHPEPTVSLLTRAMGFREVREGDGRFRVETGGGPGGTVDVLALPSEPRGRLAVGTVHHVAWRTPDDGEQAAWREHLMGDGLQVTPVIDRRYFRSIYFREPGGVLFEIATDPPGFAVDEPPASLGTVLRLPPWLEGARPRIQGALPPLRLPEHARAR
jgi:glyoxalase family protein